MKWRLILTDLGVGSNIKADLNASVQEIISSIHSLLGLDHGWTPVAGDYSIPIDTSSA